jgi:RNA polymerase sigma factor (sigma-70 family)
LRRCGLDNCIEMVRHSPDRGIWVPIASTERARWLATNILPLEPQLRSWLRRVTPPGLEVDDLIQESYAKLAGLPADSQIVHPKAYLFQIAKRLISAYIRHSTVISIETMAETAQLFVSEVAFTPERILSGRQELERLYDAIARLPGPCRTVFVMRKFDDMPQKAIAAELRISENTVEKLMSRSLRMIVEYLQLREQHGEKDDVGLAPVESKGQRGA